jgi:hypothetical protein
MPKYILLSDLTKLWPKAVLVLLNSPGRVQCGEKVVASLCFTSGTGVQELVPILKPGFSVWVLAPVKAISLYRSRHLELLSPLYERLILGDYGPPRDLTYIRRYCHPAWSQQGRCITCLVNRYFTVVPGFD